MADGFDLNQSGIAYLPVAEGQTGPTILEGADLTAPVRSNFATDSEWQVAVDAFLAAVAARAGAIQAELNRAATLQQTTRYRSIERLVAEALKELRIAKIDLGTEVPVSGEAGSAYVDLSQPGDAANPIIYGGDGPEESLTLFEAMMLPLQNSINALVIQQVTQSELDTVEGAALKTVDFDSTFDLRLANVTLDGSRIVGDIPAESIPSSVKSPPIIPLDGNGDPGALTDLSQEQIDRIGEGSAVIVSTGETYYYKGSGSKTLVDSYVVGADTTPSWSQISNKPVFSALATSSDAANLTGQAPSGVIPDLAISKITSLQSTLDLKQDAASAFDGSAANLTGTLSAARIADGSLGIVKISGLQSALDGKADQATTLAGYGIVNAVATDSDSDIDDQHWRFSSTNAAANGAFNTLRLRRSRSGGDVSTNDVTPPLKFDFFHTGAYTEEGQIYARWNGSGADLQFDGFASAKFSTNPEIIGTAPQLKFEETNTNTFMRSVLTGGIGFLQIGANGSGDAASSGELRISGMYGANISSVALRRAGAYREVVTENEVSLSKTYADIRALSPADGDSVFLLDWGGDTFIFDSSDQSAMVALDEMTVGEGDGRVFIAPTSDKTGASGAWVRKAWLAKEEVQFWWWMPDTTGTTDVTTKATKFVTMALNITSFTFDGITMEIGAGNFGPGAFRVDDIISYAPTRDVVGAIRGEGEHATHIICDAANSNGGLRINQRAAGAKGGKLFVHGLQIMTKSTTGGGVGLDLSDRSGGTGNGTFWTLSNVTVRGWDINASYFDVCADMSGNGRAKLMESSFIGPLDPGMAVNDYSDNDTRFSPTTLLNVSGGYDVQCHNCIFQGGKIGVKYWQGATRDENGNFEGFGLVNAQIQYQSTGTPRLYFDTSYYDYAPHGFQVGDTVRVSVADRYQYHSATVTEVFGTSIVVDIPLVTGGTIDTKNERMYVVKQQASGEGLAFFNCVFNHNQVGISALFAGQEASGLMLGWNHFNCVRRGVELDGGQQIRIQWGLPYNNHYPDPNDFAGGATDQAYLDAVAEQTDKYIDFDLRNVRQVVMRAPEARATEHPSRTLMRVRNGPNINDPTSFDIETPKIWGSFEKVFDFSELGTSGSKAVGIRIIDPDCSGLASGDVLAHFGPHCEQARVTGHTLPAGVTITDETTDGALIVSEADMKQLQTIRFEVDINTTITAGGTYNTVVANKIPHSRYLIQAGPVTDAVGDSEVLVAEGVVWSATPHNDDDVRLNINNGFGSSRTIDSKWAFICTPFATNA